MKGLRMRNGEVLISFLFFLAVLEGIVRGGRGWRSSQTPTREDAISPPRGLLVSCFYFSFFLSFLEIPYARLEAGRGRRCKD